MKCGQTPTGSARTEQGKKMADWIVTIVDGFPNIRDMKPLVRCKDCVHCADDWNGNQPMCTCELARCGESVQPDDYCSYGERKSE